MKSIDKLPCSRNLKSTLNLVVEAVVLQIDAAGRLYAKTALVLPVNTQTAASIGAPYFSAVDLVSICAVC
jgi:hypothetical protein